MKHAPRTRREYDKENVTLPDLLKDLSNTMSGEMINKDASVVQVAAKIEGTPYSVFGCMVFVETPERLIALQQAVDVVITSWGIEKVVDGGTIQ